MAYLSEVDAEYIEEFLEEEVDIEKLIKKMKENTPSIENIASQMGYDSLKEDMADFLITLQNISNHGMVLGFSGFIYHRETEDFFNKNTEEVLEYHKNMADDFGETFDTYVAGFRKSGEYILDLLEGGTQLKNDLVWAYIEGVASSVIEIDCVDIEKDYREDEDEDEEDEQTRTMQ